MVSTQCPICTGRRRFCIHKSYPLPRSFALEQAVRAKLKQSFFGPSTSVFVGRAGYPVVRAGPLAALETLPDLENPAAWVGKSYAEIITLRSMLLRSEQLAGISERSRFTAALQELALAELPPDTELHFSKVPHYRFTLSDSLQPMGPSGQLLQMRVAENVRVAPAVERIANDELKAAEATAALYAKGQDVYKITTILSSGALGIGSRKRLVPTRWSITATDDQVAKALLPEVRQFPQLREPLVGEAEFMDNHFVQLFLPGAWEFENFETWVPGSNWFDAALTQASSLRPAAPAAAGTGTLLRMPKYTVIQEHEPHAGRTSYAESQAGGYYASRIAAVELLHRLRRQSRVIVFREVGDGYAIPLGVWLVREAARRAAQSLRTFSTPEEALAFARSRLRVPWAQYCQQSRLLRQKNLASFFKGPGVQAPAASAV